MAEHADTAGRQMSSAVISLTDAAADEIDSDIDDVDLGAEEDSEAQPAKRGWSRTRLLFVVSVMAMLTAGAAVGWSVYRVTMDRQAQETRSQLVDAARQGAINLTTIDHTTIDADVQRILDSSSGAFRDDFEQRSGPFTEVVKQAQSVSEGTVTEAGVESQHEARAQVLVAVAVTTSNGGRPDPQPRAWRMRIDVEKVDDTIRITDVQFVP